MPITCIASAAFGPLSFYVRVVLRDGCCVRRSAEPAGVQLEMKNWPSHLSHRRASDVCARMFRLFPALRIMSPDAALHRSAPTTHPDPHSDITIAAIRRHASSQTCSVMYFRLLSSHRGAGARPMVATTFFTFGP